MVDGEADEQEPLHQQEAGSGQREVLRPCHSSGVVDTLKGGFTFGREAGGLG